MKEYVVVAKDEPSIDQLHLELTNDTSGYSSVNSSIIPDRPVSVANPRLANPKITHYFLSDEEAIALSDDNRVASINPLPTKDLIQPHTVPPKFLDKSLNPVTFDGQPGNFDRLFTDVSYNVNWGLRRTGLKAAEFKAGKTYDYDVDGSGVDMIFCDDGLESNHPEFADSTGVSRVYEIDWYKFTGVLGELPPKHYATDESNKSQHGTHVAAIAAGKTYGYAKNSRIYSLRAIGDDEHAIILSDLFDLIRVWHTKKPLNKNTGSRRPTVVNLSWGFVGAYPLDMNGINYRNRQITYSQPITRQDNFGQVNDQHGFRVPSIDAEIQMCEDVGVIFVRSAGNTNHKVDVLGGLDYENYYTSPSDWMGYISPNQPIYYHRGSSPMSKNTINVSSGSNIVILSENSFKERIDTFSERGPGCDVVAPGNSITSATSKYGTNNYRWGTYEQTGFKTATLTGTSQAAPQVSGIIALYLQRYPAATPADIKKWIKKISIKDQLLSNNQNDDWNNNRSLLGGENNYLYNPFRNGYRD